MVQYTYELIACRFVNLALYIPFKCAYLVHERNVHSCAYYFGYVAFVAFVFIQIDIGSLRVSIAISSCIYN